MQHSAAQAEDALLGQGGVERHRFGGPRAAFQRRLIVAVYVVLALGVVMTRVAHPPSLQRRKLYVLPPGVNPDESLTLR